MIVITPNYNYGIYSTVQEEGLGLRCDSVFLPFSVIGTTYTVSLDDSLVSVDNPTLRVEDITNLVKKIDQDVDKIYADSVGNRVTEYALAEQEAIAYKAAGYSGDAPSTVQSWASAKGKSAQWATDDMIITANGWRTAQGAMRSTRLAKKELARSATSIANLTVIETDWNNFVSVIRSQLLI